MKLKIAVWLSESLEKWFSFFWKRIQWINSSKLVENSIIKGWRKTIAWFSMKTLKHWFLIKDNNNTVEKRLSGWQIFVFFFCCHYFCSIFALTIISSWYFKNRKEYKKEVWNYVMQSIKCIKIWHSIRKRNIFQRAMT